MSNRPTQFGIFALLVLTTAAAAAFAIIRLPLPLIAKFLIVQTVAVCFLGWAVRNRKYVDPRKPQPKATARQIVMSLVPALLGGVAWLLLMLLLYMKIIVP